MEDQGLKMRIQSSKVLDEQMRALKSPAAGDGLLRGHQALQTGVVDGTENPPSNLYTQKMYEVQKHVTISNHGYLGYAVITNKKFWDGLPGNVRDQLEKAMDEATEYANSIAKDENVSAMAAVKASGKSEVHTPTAEERSALKKALYPVHKEMTSRIGKETIEAVHQGHRLRSEQNVSCVSVVRMKTRQWRVFVFIDSNIQRSGALKNGLAL